MLDTTKSLFTFKLYDKAQELIGFEFHIPNEYGIIQIYHQSLRGDFDNDDLKLVREGYFIPASL